MEANEIIKKLLQEIGLPVAEEIYFGRKSKYITFNEAAQKGINHADNCAQDYRTSYQVHYFCPLSEDDSYNIIKKIRNLLSKECIYVQEVVRMRDEEAQKRHIVIGCQVITKNEDIQEE